MFYFILSQFYISNNVLQITVAMSKYIITCINPIEFAVIRYNSHIRPNRLSGLVLVPTWLDNWGQTVILMMWFDISHRCHQLWAWPGSVSKVSPAWMPWYCLDASIRVCRNTGYFHYDKLLFGKVLRIVKQSVVSYLTFEISRLRKSPNFSTTISLVLDYEGHKAKRNDENSCGVRQQHK